MSGSISLQRNALRDRIVSTKKFCRNLHCLSFVSPVRVARWAIFLKYCPLPHRPGNPATLNIYSCVYLPCWEEETCPCLTLALLSLSRQSGGGGGKNTKFFEASFLIWSQWRSIGIWQNPESQSKRENFPGGWSGKTFDWTIYQPLSNTKKWKWKRKKNPSFPFVFILNLPKWACTVK